MGKVSIRTTKTSSGNTAVQVVRYEDRKVQVLRHIGSARDVAELQALRERAEAVAHEFSRQQTLFGVPEQTTISLRHTVYLGARYTFAYRLLATLLKRFGFTEVVGALAADLVLIRIIEPCSKRRSLSLLERYFGVSHAERTLYRTLKRLPAHKSAVECCALAVSGATPELSLVLYDVTTLYFETHQEDDKLRSRGFSKDNKPQQPQVVIGLLVDRMGCPLGYEIFPGKTFEGHTMLPLLDEFAAHHGVATKTVVADAAMLSRDNIARLERSGYQYIVGARLGNLPPALIENIAAAVPRKHDATRRFSTDRGDLIVSFSKERYAKDKGDLKRQWTRAEKLVGKGESGHRAKYVKKDGGTYILDAALKQKAESLLGLKGYHTNIPEATLASTEVIKRYGDLWRVEASFRMAKSDLAARPIFHRFEDSIRAHLLICFAALSVSRYIERTTGRSIRAVRDDLMQITEAHLLDRTTGETITMPMPLTEEAEVIVKKLGVSY